MAQTKERLIIAIMAPRPSTGQGAFSYETLEGFYEGIEAQGPCLSVEHLRPATWATLEARLKDRSRPAVDILLVEAPWEPAGLLDAAGKPLALEALAALIQESSLSLVLLHWLSGHGSASQWAEQLAAAAKTPVLLAPANLPREAAKRQLGELLAQLFAGETIQIALESLPTAPTLPPAWDYYGPYNLRLVEPCRPNGSGIGAVIRFPSPGLKGPLEQLPKPGEPGALPPAPPMGLIGRASEVIALESLLEPAVGGALWIYGYDGLGKTALVSHTARWLVRTGCYERVVYTSLACSGIPDAALYDLGYCLVGEGFRVDENALEVVLEALQKHRTLIIWDDVQSISPGGDLYTEQAASEWYHLARRLAEAQPSRLCLLSDGLDLPEGARRLGSLQTFMVAPMLEADAQRFLEGFCRAHNIPHPSPDAVQRLVQAFGGHPLALGMIAAQFLLTAPPTLMERLWAEYPILASGEARYRNQGLEIAVDHLARTLASSLGQRLPWLGAFAGGFTENIGLGILGIEISEWQEASHPLFTAGLLEKRPIKGLAFPWIRIHSALRRLARQRLTPRERQAMGATYYTHYLAFFSWMLRMLQEHPNLIARMAYLELGNARTALQLALERQDLVFAVNLGQAASRLLEHVGLPQEVKRLSQSVQSAIAEAVPQSGPLGRPGMQFLLNQAERLTEEGQLASAGLILQQLLARTMTPDGLAYAGPDAALDQAHLYTLLGKTLRLNKRFDSALLALRQAMERLATIEQGRAVWHQRLATQRELVDLFIDWGRLQEAQQYSLEALQTARFLQSPEMEANLYARLATIALRLERMPEALDFYAQALDRFQAANNPLGMASMEVQLASIAARAENLALAQEHLKRALEHARAGRNPLLEGQILTQMAQFAASEDPAHAEALFREAMALYQREGLTPAHIATQMSLAELLLRQGRLEEAQAEAEAAARIAEGQSPNIAPWELYWLLQRIAQARNDAKQVAHWRAATQETFARSTQAASLRARWEPVIKALAKTARGEAMDAGLAQALEQMEQLEEWRALGDIFWRILSGERGDHLWRDLDHVDALLVQMLLDELARPEADAETSAPS